MFGSRIASTAAVRVGQRRMSTAAPKMHKWAESGEALVKTRPPPGHEHTVFEPPFSVPVVAFGVIGVLTTGYGMMYFGMRHQQYKQGYWK